MKKFKFKLAQVLKYRLLLENIAKTAYQESLSDLQEKINKLNDLGMKRLSASRGLNIKKGAEINPQTLEFISLYVKQLSHLIEIQKEIIVKQRHITEEKLAEWTMKRKDSKVIKKLEEKQKREYIKMAEKEEQKFLDDIFLAKKALDRTVERDRQEMEV
jgi:flagellar export protein FliJ